jgi:hypothetical protein
MIKRFRNLLPVLRSRLALRGPPSDIGRNPVAQTLAHLRAVFGDDDPLRGFQLDFQKPFFATA